MGAFSTFLQKSLDKKGLSMSAFARVTGISKSLIHGYIKENATPHPDTLRKIAEYLEMPIEELIAITREEDPIPYVEQRRKTKTQGKGAGMPVYESSTMTLSNIESYRDEIQDEPDFWLNIPQYRKCTHAFRAKGDSMHPLIRNHALVGGRQILDTSPIIYGDVYIVHTKNGHETIKYIHPDPGNEERVLLVPYNEAAKSTPIMKTDIIRLFVAEFVLNPI